MKVNLVLNGKDVCLGGLGPQAKRVVEFVRSIPEGKYYDAHGIAECLKASRGATEQNLRKNLPEIEGHSLLIPGEAGLSGRRIIYGSKRSILDLKKRLQAADLI